MALTNLERQEYDIVQIFSVDDVVSRAEFESAKSRGYVYSRKANQRAASAF